MVNDRYIVIEIKTISYSPMCLTQVPIISHLNRMFCLPSLQQNVVTVA
jgi:hypothetical protein